MKEHFDMLILFSLFSFSDWYDDKGIVAESGKT